MTSLFCPTVYVGTQSCDLAVIDSPSATQLYVAKSTAFGTTLAESPKGSDLSVKDVAIDRQGYIYLAEETIVNTSISRATLEKLTPEIDSLGEWGPNLPALGITEPDLWMAIVADNKNNVWLMSWTGALFSANPTASSVLNLWKINSSEVVIKQYSGLSWDFFPARLFEGHQVVSMDILNDRIIYYTTGGQNVFRFDINGNGSQLTPFITAPTDFLFGNVRLRPDGSLLVPLFDDLSNTGVMALYDKNGSLVQTFPNPGVVNYAPQLGVALGEDNDTFWADRGHIASNTSIDKFRISTNSHITSVPLLVNDGNPFIPGTIFVTSMISCHRRPGGGWMSSTLIGAN